LEIARLDRIKKENKTLQDLLDWNKDVQDLMGRIPQVEELSIKCHDFKIFNPLSEKFLCDTNFERLRALKIGQLESDSFPKQLHPNSILNTSSLKTLTLQFKFLSSNVSDVLLSLFRDPRTQDWKERRTVTSFSMEYDDREREALLILLRGVMHENKGLREFALISSTSYSLLNVNNFVENTETYKVGPTLRKLTLRDGFKYSERTKFMEHGTINLKELTINKSIIMQKNFRLGEALRVLKLAPVHFPADSFELNFDQFLFVIESLQHNMGLQHFEIGVVHGNMKKKIFNHELYERERRVCTQKLANAIQKLLSHNKTLQVVAIQYKHAHFDECLKIAQNVLAAVRHKVTAVKEFNGFPVYDFIFESHRTLHVPLLTPDFDAATYDPIYCALAIQLLNASVTLKALSYTPLQDEVQKRWEIQEK